MNLIMNPMNNRIKMQLKAHQNQIMIFLNKNNKIKRFKNNKKVIMDNNNNKNKILLL